MRLITADGPFRGEVELPISKSIANRYQIISALAGQELPLPNSLPEDVKVLRDALVSKTSEINIGMAGTAMRFLTAFFSVQEGKTIFLTGNERMQQRPIAELVGALQQLGADIAYTQNDGFPPIRITGKKLKGGEVEVSASVSSQFVSALMMIGPRMTNGLRIKLKGKILSQPYIELTAECMRTCGEEVRLQKDSIFIPAAEYRIPPISIEADWTAASYFYALAAARPNSKLLLKGLTLNSPQGDSVLASWFGKMGVSSTQNENGVEISSTETLSFPTELDFTDHPDLAQTFAFLATTLGQTLKLTGLDNLRLKETDRIAALRTELEKLGVLVSVVGNEMSVSGPITVKEANVITYNDHRMAMGAAILSAGPLLSLQIQDPEVVEKSFPLFWKELKKLGIG